jgi:hypothetical protein
MGRGRWGWERGEREVIKGEEGKVSGRGVGGGEKGRGGGERIRGIVENQLMKHVQGGEVGWAV